jgi:hypothetical protein
MQLQESHCFGVDEKGTGLWGCRGESDGVPQLLVNFMNVTRFCMTKSGAAPRNWPNKLVSKNIYICLSVVFATSLTFIYMNSLTPFFLHCLTS